MQIPNSRCPGTWMADYQERFRPHFLILIQGDHPAGEQICHPDLRPPTSVVEPRMTGKV